MTRTDYRIVKRDLHREKLLWLYKTAAMILCSMLLLVVMVTAITTNASDDIADPRIKYYTSVRVQEGDSLWDLSEAYLSDEYSCRSDYIEEVQQLNHLSDDQTIHEGAYLVFPYYSSELRMGD